MRTLGTALAVALLSGAGVAAAQQLQFACDENDDGFVDAKEASSCMEFDEVTAGKEMVIESDPKAQTRRSIGGIPLFGSKVIKISLPEVDLEPGKLFLRFVEGVPRAAGKQFLEDLGILPEERALRFRRHKLASQTHVRLEEPVVPEGPGFVQLEGIEVAEPPFYNPKICWSETLSEVDRIMRPLPSIDPYAADLPPGVAICYSLRVHIGHEELWAMILNSAPEVESAVREPGTKIASTEGGALVHFEENRLPRPSLAILALPSSGYQQLAVVYLKEWFESKGAEFTIISRDKNRVRIRVERLRGEIIRGAKWWESMTIDLFLVGNEEGISNLYLICDGSYAPGAGSTQPRRESFIDMEHSHNDYLTEYTKILVTQLVARLEAAR
jgi:hypothetical protein